MSEVLTEARHSIFSYFDPQRLPFGSRQRTSLEQLLEEIKLVESVKAWKSVSALSGQLVEALLRQRLLDAGLLVIGASPATLGSLIETARDGGIIADYDETPSVQRSITTARVLRNWSSHADLWHQHPTELRATQSLALAVAMVETLYPGAPTTFSIIPDPPRSVSETEISTFAPKALLNHLSNDGQSLFSTSVLQFAQALEDHVLTSASLSTVVHFLGHLDSFGGTPDRIREGIISHMGSLLRSAARSHFRHLLSCISLLRRFCLSDLARVLSILLPFDHFILARLIERRSPTWVSRYVSECRAAEPGVFTVVLGRPQQIQSVSNAFWTRFAEYRGNIINAANILGCMPVSVRGEIMSRAPPGTISTWVRNNDISDSVNLARSLGDAVVNRVPAALAVRILFLEEFELKLHEAVSSELAVVPLRLSRLRLEGDGIADIIVIQILRELEARLLRGLDDWESVRRILWDSAAFFPCSGALAFQIIEEIMRNGKSVIPPYYLCCFLGIQSLQGGPSRGGRRVSDFDLELVEAYLKDERRDRWQRFLVLLGIQSLGEDLLKRLDDEVVNGIRELLSETRPPEGTVSMRLLSEMEKMLRSISE